WDWLVNRTCLLTTTSLCPEPFVPDVCLTEQTLRYRRPVRERFFCKIWRAVSCAISGTVFGGGASWRKVTRHIPFFPPYVCFLPKPDIGRNKAYSGIPAFRNPSLRRSRCFKYAWLVSFKGTGERLRNVETVTSGFERLYCANAV